MSKPLSLVQFMEVLNFAASSNAIFSKRRRSQYPLIKSIEPIIDLQTGTVVRIKLRGAECREFVNPTWEGVMAFLTNTEDEQ